MRRSTPFACPREKALLRAGTIGGANVHVCGTCLGTFFPAGALFDAAGIDADPATWDRPETGGAVKDGPLVCPSCEAPMHAQDVRHEGAHVEIDRCGKCKGIWLDADELDTLVSIGNALRSTIELERKKARDALSAEGEPNLAPILTTRRLKLAFAAVAVLLVGYTLAHDWLQKRAADNARWERANQRKDSENKEGGCPCGCDRSHAMAAELRERGDASGAIDATLTTIAEREAIGYVTERMVEHRLRMLDVARDLGASPPTGATTRARCTTAPVEAGDLRVCADLVVHGERWETIRGTPKLVTSSFRLWLEIENLSPAGRQLAVPSLDGGQLHFPVSRWYEEGTAGEFWNGQLAAGAKIRVNVIGYVSERVAPGTSIDAAIAVGPVTTRARTDALADLHF